MSLAETITILVVLCLLFNYGVCRAPIIESTLVKSIKTPKNITEIQGRNGVHTSTQPQWPFDNAKHHCKGIIRTKADDAKKFFGTRAAITLYKSRVEASQWSTGRMKLSNGPESIEAGYMVNPAVFDDYEAHLYSKFVVNGKECINRRQCSDFVEVDSESILGGTPTNYSQIRGPQFVWDIGIEKHQDGHWWISTYTNGVKVYIGYWPNSLFTSLAGVATQVEWGGEIDNPWAKDDQPEMGSGIVAFYDTKISAGLWNVTIVNQNYEYVLPTDTEKESDCPLYYNSLDMGYEDDYWGRLMFFGGPHGGYH